MPADDAYVRPRTQEYSEDVRRVCCFVYCGAGGRSPARTSKLAQRYLEPLGESTPSAASIAVWAREERWSDQAEAIWRHNAGAMMVDTQFAVVSAMHAAAQNFADSVAGVSDQSYEERALRAAEFKTAMQAAKDVPALAKVSPVAEEKIVDATSMTKEEYETRGRALLKKGD